MRSNELRYVGVNGLLVSIMVNLAPIVRYFSNPAAFEPLAGYSPIALALKILNCYLFGLFFSLLYLDFLGSFSEWFHRQVSILRTATELILFVVLTEFLFQLHLFLVGPSLNGGVLHFWYFAQNLAHLIGVYGFWHYLKAVRESNKATIENEELKRLEVKNQLDALNNQLNPHFLFNALNILNVSIITNPSMAQSIVYNLSDILRYNLKIQNQNLVRLSEELEVAQSFLELYKARFGNKLVFHLANTNLHKVWYIVPLSLQLLIENAIKHNVITSNHILHISVEVNEQKGHLVITNSVNKKNHTDGLGIGLSNLGKRYELITGRATLRSENAQHFVITIPLIEAT